MCILLSNKVSTNSILQVNLTLNFFILKVYQMRRQLDAFFIKNSLFIKNLYFRIIFSRNPNSDLEI